MVYRLAQRRGRRAGDCDGSSAAPLRDLNATAEVEVSDGMLTSDIGRRPDCDAELTFVMLDLKARKAAKLPPGFLAQVAG